MFTSTALSSPQLLHSVRQRCMSSEARLVVSRRLWNKHSHRFQNKSTTDSISKKNMEEEKPWPKNWIIFFSVSAGTLIPYFGLWFVSSNATLREAVLPVEDESNKFMKWVRSHFGHEDLHSRSYCDIGKVEAEYRLLDELSAADRALELQKRHLDDQNIRVRVGFVTENMGTYQLATEMKEHALLGSLPANTEILKETLTGTRNDDALEIMTGSPVVQFLDGPIPEDTDESTVHDSSIEPSKNQEDPLFHNHYAMSLWQVVDPAMIPNSEKRANTTTTSWEEIERNRLEYELVQLQDEIRMGSSRSVDDVREELRRVQEELRKRTWKRWLPWNSL